MFILYTRVYMVEKNKCKTGILLKKGIVKITHLTLVNFKILAVYEVTFITKLLPWNWLEKKIGIKIKCCGYFWHSLDDRYVMSPASIRPVNTVAETLFSEETSKFFPRRCLIIFCIFYLNEEELIKQVCLKNI